MTSTDTPAVSRRCLRCRRPLQSAASIAAGYGPGCRAKVRKAGRTADLSAWSASQAEDAHELIDDGGVVPGPRPDVFWTVSTDGAEKHLTHVNGCNCPNGLRTRPARPCYHRLAVLIVLGSLAPAVHARQPLVLAA